MAEPLETSIPKTQEVLQPLVAKPKLSEKLLAKPPFRFLHDVFAAVLDSTGFPSDLYNAVERDSANIKDKAQKTAYLDKMIVCVSTCLDRQLDVRSTKIVSGAEPECTNLFLQALAEAATSSSSNWKDAVEKTLSKVPSLTPEGELVVVSAEASEPATTSVDEKPAKPKSSESKKRADNPPEAKQAPPEPTEEAEAKPSNAPKLEKKKSRTATPPNPDATQDKQESAPKESTPAPKPEKKKSRPKPSGPSAEVAPLIEACNGDVERTKELVEGIISKPKMSTKLLGKPPFRFLHDMISEITRTTGFAEGLYTAEELDSGNIKDKQAKMDYLNKIIQCVNCHLHVQVEAKPAKIVAGLDPEDTNYFLQLLTIACRHGNSAEAVQRVLSGDTSAKSGSGSGSRASKSERAESKAASRDSTPQETKRRPSSKEAKKEKPQTEVPSGNFSGPVKSIQPQQPPAPEDDDDDRMLQFGSDPQDDDEDRPYVSPGTATGFGTSRTARPTTARRRPPKLKENVTEAGRLLAPDVKAAPVAGIMKDGDNEDSDDETAADDVAGPSDSAALVSDDPSTHGRLVRDILKNQSADDGGKKQEEDVNITDAEAGIRLGRRRKTMKDKSGSAASSASEMNELRATIQRLCQAANPVGKSIEFVHEDLDAMTKELDKWRSEYDEKNKVYEKEKKRTDEALQPLQLKLVDMEEQVKEQVHKINTLKATIAKNDEKTQKLLRMVVSA